MRGVIGIGMGLLWVTGLWACHESQTPHGSSGSNWLVCDEVADCDHPDAVDCDGKGYCVDDAGDRIPAPTASGDGDSTVGATGDGDMEPDGQATGDGDAEGICAWGVDAMLAEVGFDAKERLNCGSTNGALREAVASGMACFAEALDDGYAVEFTVNNCTDCSIPTTYVGLPTGERFALRMENDAFGDALLESRITRCDAITVPTNEFGEPQEVQCEGAQELYDCSESRDFARDIPELPLKPQQVADVAPNGTEPVALLHLYVSNQSFVEPLVRLYVRIDGTTVVIGDFDVEDQHNWTLFDLSMPTGAHMLEVEASSPDGDQVMTFELLVPGERWAVLDYWDTGEDSGNPEPFTFTVHEAPVAFN